MSATHRQGLGPVVGDLFLDTDVPACERVTVSRNGWSAEVTHLWTGTGWTRLVPGPVHHVPAQPLETRSSQPPQSSPSGTRKRSSKKAAPPAPLQPAARRVPVRQVRPPAPAVTGPVPAVQEPGPAAGSPVDDGVQPAPVTRIPSPAAGTTSIDLPPTPDLPVPSAGGAAQDDAGAPGADGSSSRTPVRHGPFRLPVCS